MAPVMNLNSYKKGIIKHPHSEGKSGKVYIGDTLKNSIDAYNERNPQNAMPPIECSGKTYSYRLLAAAGKELESSELLHRFYGRRSFHEIEMVMCNKKYEFQQEIRRICESLAEMFPHVLATADLWAAHEALKGKLCNRKAEQKRETRKRENGTTGSGTGETNSRIRRQQEVAAKKAEHLVQARRRKAQQRKIAETCVEKDEAHGKESLPTCDEVSVQTPVSTPKRGAVAEFGNRSKIVESQSESSEEEITTTHHTRRGPQSASDNVDPSTSQQTQQTKPRTTPTPSEEEADYEPSMVGGEIARVKSKETKKQKYPSRNAGRDASGDAPSVSISRGKRQNSSVKKTVGATKKGRALKAMTAKKRTKAKMSTSTPLVLDEEKDDVSSMVDTETAGVTNAETKRQGCPATDVGGDVLENSTPVSRPRHRQTSSVKQLAGSKRKYRALNTISDEEQELGGRRRNRSLPKRYRQ